MNGGRDDRTKQSTRAAEDSERSDVSGAQPAPMAVPHRLGWRGVWWFACGVAGTLAIVWFIIFSRGEIGSKAEWFFGAVVFCVVMVTMWQTLNIQRQANQHAAEAAERLCTELVAAEERAARELAMTQALHRVEMQAREKVFRAEMEAQRELARVERGHLINQLQKQAMVEVSRAVNAHTQMRQPMERGRPYPADRGPRRAGAGDEPYLRADQPSRERLFGRGQQRQRPHRERSPASRAE